jgi:hypothetical protein
MTDDTSVHPSLSQSMTDLAERMLDAAEGCLDDTIDHVEDVDLRQALARLIVALDAKGYMVMDVIGDWYSALVSLNGETLAEQASAQDALRQAV